MQFFKGMELYIFKYSITLVCLAIGSIAAHWNIPVISFGCILQTLGNKNSYPTFIRIAAEAGNIVKAVAEMFIAYDWDEAFVLYSLYVAHSTIFFKYMS